MSSRLFEALATRWTAQNLGNTFTGGIHYEEAPSHTVFPYVVLTPLGNSPDIWTTDGEIRVQAFQLTIYAKEDNISDPVSAMGTFMRTIQSAFDFAPLPLSGGAAEYVIEMRRTRDDIRRDPSAESVWQGQIDYAVRRHAAVTYSPS